MAYMSQEHKKEIAAVVKTVAKKHGMKVSLAVRNHSTIVATVKSGKIDFAADCIAEDKYDNFKPIPFKGHTNVNHYWLETSWKGKALAFLKELNKALHGPRFFDKSDPMTDYFHCSHYISINIGRYDADYILEK